MIYALILTALIGQRSVIEGPSTATANHPIILDGSKSQSNLPLHWQLLRGDSTTTYLLFDKASIKNGAIILPDPKPGIYRFALIALMDTGSTDVSIFDLTVTPVLSSTSPRLYVIQIYSPLSSSATSLSAASIRANESTSKQLATLNAEWRAWDKDSPNVKKTNLSNYLPDVLKLPVVFIYDSHHFYDLNGTIIPNSNPIKYNIHPSTLDSLITAIKGVKRP